MGQGRKKCNKKGVHYKASSCAHENPEYGDHKAEEKRIDQVHAGSGIAHVNSWKADCIFKYYWIAFQLF